MISLTRTVSDLRARFTRLKVQYKDLETSSKKEISKLTSQIKVEKQRRVNVQEDKVEKSSSFLHELDVRNTKISHLANEVADLKLEKSELESNLNETNMNSSKLLGFNRS
mmetsp:Transcript_21051/g.32581  ORF Transcript_21051/g.32581 Transcript_21051/m.32581 type:complete len:110 (+) Transcript_21051:2873-3202(+)